MASRRDNSFNGIHTIPFIKRPATSRASLVEYSTNVKWPKVQSSKPLDNMVRYAISRYMIIESTLQLIIPSAEPRTSENS